MADTEAAPQDKTKEKKKKKSGSTKEKETKKKSTAESDHPEDVKGNLLEGEAPKQEPVVVEAQPEPPAAAATANGEAPPEATKKSKKKSVSKEVTEVPPSNGESGHAERKTSVAEGAPQPEGDATPAGASHKASTVDGANAETKADDEPPPKRSPDEIPIIGTTYVPPPPATTHDIDLLEDMDKNKLMELKELFEIVDYDHDGYIDLKDLKLTYQSLGYLDVPDEDIETMLSEAMNPLDFDAFVYLLGYKTIEMDPESVLVEALACWDFNNTGLIPEERIKHDIMTWGDKFTEEEAELALEDAPIYVDKKGVPMIDYLKFSNNLCGLRKKSRQNQSGDA